MTPEELDTFWSTVDGEWVRVEEMEPKPSGSNLESCAKLP